VSAQRAVASMSQWKHGDATWVLDVPKQVLVVTLDP